MMMNLVEKFEDLIFVVDSLEPTIVLVARASWFKDIKISDWNGSNWQSIILDDEGGSRFCEITDEERKERFIEILESTEEAGTATGYSYERSGSAMVTYSQWQGDWALASIEENFYDAEAEC